MGFLRMAAAKSPLAPLYERGDVAVQHCARDADILGNASSREAESSLWALRHGKSIDNPEPCPIALPPGDLSGYAAIRKAR